MEDKSKFLDRVERFDVSASEIVKYHEIYDKMSRSQQIGEDELKERASRLFFAGYVWGGRLLTNKQQIETKMQSCFPPELRRIPVAANINLVNLRTVRRSRSVNLKSFGATHIYVEPLENGTPSLTIADVVSQLSLTEVAGAKAFSLRLKKDFAETGYLHLAKAYEFMVELWA